MTKPVIPTPETSPYSLPLTHEEFRVALARGWGRAWLHVDRHGGAGLHDILLHALLNCQTYDPQIEGDRSGWLMAITDLAGAGDSVYSEFISSVHELPVCENQWQFRSHTVQRATVLGLLAKRGFAGARGALERLFLDNCVASGDDIIGGLDIIELDGEQGLVQVASVLGHRAHEAGVADVVDWFLSVFDEDREEGAGLRVLEAARGSDPGVEWFLRIREAAWARIEAAERQAEAVQGGAAAGPFGPEYEVLPRLVKGLNVEQVLDWIRNAPPKPQSLESVQEGRFWLQGWGSAATEPDLDRVLLALEQTEDSLQHRRLLCVFGQRPMPRLPEKVLVLAETGERPVRARAYVALSHLADPRVRDLATRCMSAEQFEAGSLRLWRSSFQRGDHRTIEEGLVLSDDVESLHMVLFHLVDVCVHGGRPECVPLMLLVCAHSPCSTCRGQVVECMVKLGVAPDWLLAEARFDASEFTRELLGGPKW